MYNETQSKPRRKSGEVLDLPRSYIVKTVGGFIHQVNAGSPDEACNRFHASKPTARLLGTHESADHGAKRVGWI